MNPEAPGQDEWVTIAILDRARGNRGELAATSFSDRPERFEDLREVYLFGDGTAYAVERTWFHEGRLVFKFQGIDDISAAERLAGAEVRVPRARRAPLEPGEYYRSDLIGCQVIERGSETALGRVANWREGGGAGLLELDSGLLIPFARAICVDIDPERGRIEVVLPEGLKELNET